jgi:DNA-binding NarL/FixJ family response regulator
VAGAIERGDQVLQEVAALQPDVVVLDVALPHRSGLKVLPELRRAYPLVGIVMLSNRSEPIYREEAARRGADAYVVKDRASAELWPAIRAAALMRRQPAEDPITQGLIV